MKLPFPYVRWDKADSVDGVSTEFGIQGPAAHVVNGDGRHPLDFSIPDLRRMERVQTALREEGARIASEPVRELAEFDRIAAEMESAIADYRRECAAIIQMRSANGSKRKS
jgi:hypothetical protein